MQALVVVWRIQILNRQFPITGVSLLDQIGDLCKRNFKDPQVVLVECVRRDVRRLEIILQNVLLVMPSR